ncbi:MAG: tetratricopeptide repeat protein [candidate division WOR-3 bacterium]
MMDERGFLVGLAERLDPRDPHAHNNIAVILFRKGYAEDAVRELERALEIDPNFEPARRNLEAVLRTVGRKDDVLEYYLSRAQGYPDAIARRLATAEALSNMGRSNEALAEFMSVLSVRPSETRALLGAARILRKRRDYHGAEGFLKRVVEVDPGSAEAYRLLGEVHYNTQRLDIALQELEKARQLDPDSAETYYLLSFVYGEMGLLDKALECVEKASAINPKLTEAEDVLSVEAEPEVEPEPEAGGDPFQSRLELAEAYMGKGLFSDAEREIEKAKKFATSPQETQKALMAEALLYFLEGQHSTSMLLLNSMPHPNTEALILRALNSYFMGRAKPALESASLAAESGDEFACLNYGVLLYLVNRSPGEALPQLSKAESIPVAFYNKAYILLRSGDAEGAARALEHFKEARGEGVHYHNLLSEIKRVLGDDEGAEKELLSALRIDPGFGDALIGLGSIYFKKKSFARFFEFMRQARAIRHYYRKDTMFFAFRGLSFDIPVEVSESLPPAEELERSGRLDEVLDKLLETGKHRDVLAILDELLKASPFDQRFLRVKALVYFRSGRFREAREYLSSITNPTPEDRLLLALSEEWLGNWAAALKHILYMLKGQEKDPDLWAWAGRVLLRLRRPREAEMFLKKALLLDHENPEALFWVGELMISSGKHDEVQRIAQALISRGDPRGHLFLGEVAFLRERYDEASERLEEALKTGVDRARVFYLMGLMCAIRGAYEAAIKNWKEVESLAYDQALAWKAKRNIAQLENMRAYLMAEVSKQKGGRGAS